MSAGPLSTVEIEREVAPVENINKPIINTTTKFEKVTINESENVHFGPRFINSTINYIDRTRKKPIRHVLMIFIVLGCFIIITVAVTTKGHPSSKPDVTTTTESPPLTDVTKLPNTNPTPGTNGTTSPLPTPTSTPPENWLISYSDWSIGGQLHCNPILKAAAWSVSIDKGIMCETEKALRDLQGKQGLKHNFYLSQSGKVYTAYGWNCAPEYSFRYSRTNIIVAICGQFNGVQATILERLLDHGVKEKSLRREYNLIPECCRGIPERRGPGQEINKYLVLNHGTSKALTFTNKECIKDDWCD